MAQLRWGSIKYLSLSLQLLISLYLFLIFYSLKICHLDCLRQSLRVNLILQEWLNEFCLFSGNHGEFHEEEMDLLFPMDLRLWLSLFENTKEKTNWSALPILSYSTTDTDHFCNQTHGAGLSLQQESKEFCNRH